MPLPEQATLKLQPNCAPGENVPSRLKQAMVVRMSPDALSALQNNPLSLDFRFSDAPGLFIADVFYPIRPVQKDDCHELYLRAPSQTKPNAPLKLFGKVAAKFTVDRPVKDRPDPIPAISRTKKKEPVSMFRKPQRTSIPNKSAPAVPPPALPVKAPPTVPPPSTPAPTDLRIRMVHCLALNPRPIPRLVAAVGATQAQVLAVLDQIAAPGPAPNNDAAIPYKLKDVAWKEVRPWDFGKLSDYDRAKMARGARDAFKVLRIPESDPAWSYVTDRTIKVAPSKPGPTLAAPGIHPNPAEGPSKRGVTSKEMREKKAKPKPKPKAEIKEIKIKDEGIRVGPSNSTPTTVPARRPPGSGFKIPKSDASSADQESHTPPPSKQPIASSSSTSGVSRTTSAQRSKKIKQEVKQEDAGSDRERLVMKSRASIVVKEESSSTVKRKASQRQDEHTQDDSGGPLVKRRRTDDPSRSSSSSFHPARDLSLPKKPDVPLPRSHAPNLTVTAPMRRVKEPSPPPGASAARKNKSKIRREAQYTSSEDDEPLAPSSTKRQQGAPALSGIPVTQTGTRSTRDVGNQVLPATRADLRDMYNTEYIKHLGLTSRLLGQKSAIQKTLNKRSSSYTSESESDLMDVDEITVLAQESRTCRERLDRIRAKFDENGI